MLKLNDKTDIPSAIDPLLRATATVADPVRLGADAVGHTLRFAARLRDILPK